MPIPILAALDWAPSTASRSSYVFGSIAPPHGRRRRARRRHPGLLDALRAAAAIPNGRSRRPPVPSGRATASATDQRLDLDVQTEHRHRLPAQRVRVLVERLRRAVRLTVHREHAAAVPHGSYRVSSRQPAIGPPPAATTATSQSGTCRAPHSPRSWRMPSARKPKPWRRPPESWPPQVLSGSSPPSASAPALDEGAALAAAAEAERLDPRQRQPAEAVVELGGVDVGRLQVGARPHLRGGVARRHRRQVFPLIPARAASGSRCRWRGCAPPACGRSRADVGVRDDDRRRAVARRRRSRRGRRARSPCARAR